MLNDNAGWIAIVAILLALLLAGAVTAASSRAARARASQAFQATRRFARRRPHRQHFRPEGAAVTEEKPKRAAIIINPTKFDNQSAVRARITKGCREQGWDEPLFIETTAEDTGERQTREAVEQGATVVCALGGDGTVRAVASALVGTETPMGLLPGGTGNLLARNLDLPVALEAAVAVALTGRNRRIDVGEIVIGSAPMDDAPDETGDPETHYFLVMSGIGMDAQIMAGTNENLKAKVGWPAYMVSGLKHLVSPEFRIAVKVDDELEFRRRARMVVIGNCGRLLGGLVLMPNARVDDGQLDTVIASPRGVVGWVPVATRVATRQRKGHPTLDHKVCKEIRVRTDRPVPVQIDGDVIGEASEVSATVRPGCLTVRVSQ